MLPVQVSMPILTVSNNLLKIWVSPSPWPGGSGAPPGVRYFFVPLGTPFCNAIASLLPVSPELPVKPMPLCHCIPKHSGKWLPSGPSHGARSPGRLLASGVAEPLQGARFSGALHSFFQVSPAFSVATALSKLPRARRKGTPAPSPGALQGCKCWVRESALSERVPSASQACPLLTLLFQRGWALHFLCNAAPFFSEGAPAHSVCGIVVRWPWCP